ncbi:MAG: hypothetical protein M3Y56_06610, partial [Armatimonadota bacterium]|nr:hypothetical protein [Armatimonadota bacterium]
VSIIVYLWSVIFVAFAHDHVQAELGLRQTGSRTRSTQHLRTAPRGAPPGDCPACTWDQNAGNSIVPCIFVQSPPPTTTPSPTLHPQFACQSSRRSYSSRAPPVA